ncbi:phosphoglycerate kinase [Candidatus Uhrbacteria bacterium]|nr:phosphoglycerate kinase [Candidatus Uhrbacteria bacterium]
MKLKGLKDIDLKEKRVIFRVAYDVPLKEKGKHMIVTDDSRILASLPTLRYLLRKKCKVIILTWLGRPGGKRVEKLTLDPVSKRLSELLKKSVKKLDACVGPGVDLALSKMKPGDVVMLENVRFEKDEEEGNNALTKKLSKMADVVVFDAFAQSHRTAPSTTGILSAVPSVAGLNMEEEISKLSKLLEKPKAPFVVILGGAKMSDKIETLINLLHVADVVLIGGAMAHNFLKAQGMKIAGSLVEDASHESKKVRKKIYQIAEDILAKTKDTYVNLGSGLNMPKIVLPRDLISAHDTQSPSQTCTIELSDVHHHIPWNWMYLDIGPKTVALYSKIIERAKTIFWNGPLGYFEESAFSHGTKGIAVAITKSKALSVLGGGDTESMIKKFKLQRKFDYISTGGGAVLEFLSGKPLPVIKYLLKN